MKRPTGIRGVKPRNEESGSRMASETVVNGVFTLGGVGIGAVLTFGGLVWQQRATARAQNQAWVRSTVGEVQRRLVAVGALGREVPPESDDSRGEERRRWKVQLDGLIDEIEVHVLSLPGSAVRERVIAALGFMRHCTGYADIAHHYGESISVAGVLYVTTADAKSCLACYLRGEDLPGRPERYQTFDQVDAYEEEQYQFQLEMEAEERAKAKESRGT